MNTDDLSGEREVARKLEAVLEEFAMGSIIKCLLETEAEIHFSEEVKGRRVFSKDLGKLENFWVYVEGSEFTVIYLSLY